MATNQENALRAAAHYTEPLIEAMKDYRLALAEYNEARTNEIRLAREEHRRPRFARDEQSEELQAAIANVAEADGALRGVKQNIVDVFEAHEIGPREQQMLLERVIKVALEQAREEPGELAEIIDFSDYKEKNR